MKQELVQYYHAINPKAVAAFDQIIREGYILDAIFLSSSGTSGYDFEFKPNEAALPSGLFERPLSIGGFSQVHLFFQIPDSDDRLVLATRPVECAPIRANLPFSYEWMDFEDPWSLTNRAYIDLSSQLRQRIYPRVFLKGLNYTFQELAIYGLVYEGCFEELLFDGEEDDDPDAHPILDVDMHNFIVFRSRSAGTALHMYGIGIQFLRDSDVGVPTFWPFQLPYQIRHQVVR